MGNLQVFAAILNLILTHNLNKMNMIIYEVNLSIELDLENTLIAWFKCHIKEMLEFKGFTSVSLLKDMEKIVTSANWVL